MPGTTSIDHTAAASAVTDLRAAAGACPEGSVPVKVLGPALLGGWPANPEGAVEAVRVLVDLAGDRDPLAIPLVRGLLAAEPAALTQLALASRLTSLARVLGDCVGEQAAGDVRRLLAEVDPEAGGDDRERLAALTEKIEGWTADLVAERPLDAGDATRLAGLAGLEARCRLERVEHLAARGAGTPDRERLVARWREAGHDLERLSARLERGDLADPRAVLSRLAAAVGPEAMAALVAGAGTWSGGQRLARLLKQLAQPELRVEDPDAAFCRLLEVVAAQGDRPLLAADPDPLLLGVFVLERGRGSWLRFDLPGERLALAQRQGFEPPPGVVVVGEALFVACTPAEAELPPEPNRARAMVQEEEADEGQAAKKQLVLSNIGTTSVLLEFLRDAKMTSIPGLVEEIVNRTRNPQVLEVIASTRTLSTGFANRNVPLALLRSPVNVSVRTLRRFIHVKYISKLELKRLAQDKSGLRKEVHREIEKYLASLR